MDRPFLKLYGYLITIGAVICYGAYQANPALAVGCGVAVAGAFVVGGLIARHKQNQVRQMVADVDAGADRYIAGADQ